MAVRIGMRRLLCGALAVTALAAVSALQTAPDAQATSIEQPFSISVTGTAGNYFFTPRNAAINVTQTWNKSAYGTYEAIEARVTQGGIPQYTFDFATPNGSGHRLAVGFYNWAQEYPVIGPGRPQIAVHGETPGCGNQTGRFEVRDIHRVGLKITRLWLVFERWCSPSWVESGELRLGYPQTTYDVSPRVVVWPWSTIYPGHAAQDVPVRVRLTSAKAVTAYMPKVYGLDAADFPIRKQNCTGKLTASGCTVWIGFTPKAPGPRHAKLTVPTSAGPTSVSLDGTGGVGTSSWTAGVNWTDPPRTEHLGMTSVSAGSPYEITSQAWEPLPDGTMQLWNTNFGLNNGQQMKEDTTYTYVPGQGPFFMDLSRGDGACEITSGSVTINDLAWLGPDHDLARMDADLTANCQSSTPYSVSAEMKFHARADVTSPGPVSNLKAVRDGGRVTVTWTKPPAADLAGVIVRWYAARHAPSVWWAGNTAYFGTGRSVSVKAPATQPVSVSVWTYDKTGNMSGKKSAYLAGS